MKSIPSGLSAETNESLYSPVEALRICVNGLIERQSVVSSSANGNRGHDRCDLMIWDEEQPEETDVIIRTHDVPAVSWRKLLGKATNPRLEIIFRLYRANTMITVCEQYDVSSDDTVLRTNWNEIDNDRTYYSKDVLCAPEEIIEATSRLAPARHMWEIIAQHNVQSDRDIWEKIEAQHASS